MFHEPVTVTLDAELIGQVLPVIAVLSYPFWGAVTAGLWGRTFGVNKNFSNLSLGNTVGETRFWLGLLGALWPVTLPANLAYLVVSRVARLYSPVMRAVMPKPDAENRPA